MTWTRHCSWLVLCCSTSQSLSCIHLFVCFFNSGAIGLRYKSEPTSVLLHRRTHSVASPRAIIQEFKNGILQRPVNFVSCFRMILSTDGEDDNFNVHNRYNDKLSKLRSMQNIIHARSRSVYIIQIAYVVTVVRMSVICRNNDLFHQGLRHE